MTAWILWLTVAAVLMTVEILSQMVWTLCLAIGCVVALVASLCGAGMAAQMSLSALSAVVAYIVLVPYFKRMHHQAAERGGAARTGMDALVGTQARVVKSIEPGQMGRVMAYGDNWQARALNPSDSFTVGEHVRIHSYDSIVLTVEKVSGTAG